MKKVIVFILGLSIISCGNEIGFDDIEIKYENKLKVGRLKSDNSLFTGDIIEFYGVQSGYSIDNMTGETYPEYIEYPAIEFHFDNGLASGVWRWYHDKGQLDTEISYKEGKYHGVRKEWDKFGDLLLVEIWEENELIYEKQYY